MRPAWSQRLARARNAITGGLGYGGGSDPDDLESRLCWIYGSGRSGSTWLLRLLTYPLEPSHVERVGYRALAETGVASGRPVLPINEPHFASHLAPQWIVTNLRESTDQDPEAYTFNGQAGAASGTSYFLSSDWEDAWRPRLRELILSRLQAQAELARDLDGLVSPVLLIKDPNASHGAHATSALLPRSRLLYLVRDGRDVVDSHIHAYAPDGWVAAREGAKFESAGERLDFVRRMSFLWARRANSVLKAWSSHAPDRRRRLRYEDLLDDPLAEVTALSDWLELGREPAWAEATVRANSFELIPEDQRGAYSIARAATPGLWQQNLTSAEQQVADEIMGPWLERLGYDRSRP